MKNYIQVSQVKKTFTKGCNIFDALSYSKDNEKRIFAVSDVSFTIAKGEIVAVTGANGAGKTTLLKLLSTLLIPDQGSISINGRNTTNEADSLKSEIGAMWCDERSFYWRLSIRGNLEFYAALYNLTKKESDNRIEFLCERLDIKDPQKRFQECSTGIKQRCALARVLIHSPGILLMDEPTRSLDQESASSLHAYIKELSRNQNVTTLFATHNRKESQAADRTINLKEGTVSSIS